MGNNVDGLLCVCLFILVEIIFTESEQYCWMADKKSLLRLKQNGPPVKTKRSRLELSDLPMV